MSDPENAPPTVNDDASRGSTWTWLLPALTFLVGAALSAALFALGDTDDATSRPLAGPSAEPTADDGEVPSPEEEVVVQVPAVCVEAAELAQTVTAALGDVADAAGALDARRLQESLDVVQQLRPDVEATAGECRDLALDGRIVTPETSPSPSPETSPSPSPASEPSPSPAPEASPSSAPAS